MCELDLAKQYGIAKSMVGSHYADLVHSSFIRYEQIKERTTITNPDTYFYRIMLSHLRKGHKFHKHYLNQASDNHLEPILEQDEPGLNLTRVEEILKELVDEGYREEVLTFIYISQNKGKHGGISIKSKTGIHGAVFKKIVTFVRNEIITRYGNNDD